MTIDPAKAAGRSESGGETHFFCSLRCKGKFDADPAHYVHLPAHASSEAPKPAATVSAGSPKSTPPANTGPQYTCPMHPEIRQAELGSCPKCGMALEPLTPPPAAAKVEWTCPMHPEIVRDAPGSCPICGMALEPRMPASAAEEENPELVDMRRRFRVSTALTLPLVFIAMAHMLPGAGLDGLLHPGTRKWIELILATPACWP
jgi:Cu+-exporting ATPase